MVKAKRYVRAKAAVKKTTEKQDKDREYVTRRDLKRVLDSVIEDKRSTAYSTEGTWSTINDAASIPTIMHIKDAFQKSEGAAQGQRIANAITLKSCMFKGVIHYQLPDGIVTYSPPLIVGRLWVCSLRGRKNVNPGIEDFANFYQNGNNSLPMYGTLRQHFYGVNTDRWVVHRSIPFTLGNLAQMAERYDPTTVAPLGTMDTNMMFKYFSIDLAKYIEKKVKYDDNQDNNVPQNVGVHVFFTAADPLNPTTPTIVELRCDFTVDIIFEDS